MRFEAEEQTRRGQLERAAQIQYGELPKLEAELKQLNALQDGNAGVARMLKEEVDEEDIARIVSKWTGIPVSRMLEGEVKKLVEMEQRLKERVIGQDAARLLWQMRSVVLARAERSAAANRQFHLSWADWSGQDGDSARTG